VRSDTARFPWSWPSSTLRRGQRKTGIRRAMRCAGSCARRGRRRKETKTKSGGRKTRRGSATPPYMAQGPARPRIHSLTLAATRIWPGVPSLQRSTLNHQRSTRIHSPVRQAQGPEPVEGLTLPPSLNKLRRAGAATHRTEGGSKLRRSLRPTPAPRRGNRR
jgi:hypothetical protein